MNSFLTRLGVVLITVYFIGLGILQMTYEGSIEWRSYIMPWLIAIFVYIVISVVITKSSNIEKY